MYTLTRDKRIFMNTTVEFDCWSDQNPSLIHKIFDIGFSKFHEVVKIFSRFDAQSELSQLNQQSGKEFKASKKLFDLVNFSLKIARLVNGVFDPTIIDFLEAYGYKKEFEINKNESLIKSEIKSLLKTRPNFNQIKLNHKNRTITLCKNQRIDLGSTAKGYAIDEALKAMSKKIKNLLINAGGDIKACGNYKNYAGWPIALANKPYNQIGFMIIKDESVCCSGSNARKIGKFHHLINPQSGIPENNNQTIFVKSKNAVDADIWATTLFVAGKNAINLAKRFNISALILSKNGKIMKNKFNYFQKKLN